MKAWVDPQDIALAQYTMRLLYNREKEYKSITKPLERAYIFTVPEIREAYKPYTQLEKQKLERVKNEYKRLTLEYAEKYYHTAYMQATLLKSSIPLFVAFPPQVTTKKQPAIKPSAYINTLFIPVKRSDGAKISTVPAKLLYKNYVMMRRYKHLDKHLELMPRLKQFVEKKTIQYTSKGYPEKRAWKLALRDALRVIIGNIWLVGIYYLVQHKYIKPQDIILPYELAKQPHLHQTMIDPKDTLSHPYILPPELRDELPYITWKWLIQITTQ
ncbi:MAG: hypothetical protein GXO43_06980 [Crenarchaeota archaeon]|nr:hypothetical protein [Thermoproteota archaeon]